MIENYHKDNYVGEKIILVASGPIEHQRLIDAVDKYIKVPRQSARPTPQITKPTFHPGLTYAESKLTPLVNMTLTY